jgi:hypothetical protein
MQFSLLVSQLPRTGQSRAYYEAMLPLEPTRSHRLANLWLRLKSRLS